MFSRCPAKVDRSSFCFSWSLLALVFSFTLTGSLSAQEKIDYANQIRPLLARKCYACHGPSDQEGGLAFHSRKLAIQEADSGIAAIVPGNVKESELVARIEESDIDIRMPPAEHEPLSKEEIALLKQWISEGAEYNSHWAFEPVPEVEIPKQSGSSSHPIDRFIDQRLKKNKLEAAPQASREVLIRRVFLDLTGLPPTPEEVEQFKNDQSPDAYEKLVDRLLDSPQYGERWARHWLDVVRYAETNSYERDSTKPNAWKYRDYIIRSFNEDKPYDQFVREQLAGDVLKNRTRDSITATGFYRLGIWDDEPADPKLARYDELDGIITTVGQGFLGLTFNCARCHDHKIDPIPQAEYYQLLSFFEELTPYGRRGDERSNSQTDVSSDDLVAKYQRNDKAIRDIKERMRKIEQLGIVKMPAPDQRATETPRRQKVLDEKLQKFLTPKQWQAYLPLKEKLKNLEQDKKRLPARETVLSVAKYNPNPGPTHIMLRGNPHVPGDTVKPAFPSLFDSKPPQFSTGDKNPKSRRVVLANWIASKENRLTARVMVNRIWQHHFGRGIVPTPNNFGLLGIPPTHPDLLNWLAGEFMQNGWKMKPIHKLIVTSEAYRRSSQAVEKSLAQDPGNNYFWRFNLRRLSAEEVRDSILATTGILNKKVYGPSIYPAVSKEVLQTQSQPGKGWGRSSKEDQARRSVYIFIKRSLVLPELANFDFPDTDSTCEARFTTIQPAQALGMINGHFLNDQAKTLAARLKKEVPEGLEKQVERGLTLVCCRPVTKEEINNGLELIDNLKQKHQLSEEAALNFFCLYALNLNEFMFVD